MLLCVVCVCVHMYACVSLFFLFTSPANMFLLLQSMDLLFPDAVVLMCCEANMYSITAEKNNGTIYLLCPIHMH